MIELPAADRWMYSTNGKDYGPVSWSVIESMVQDDRLSQDDLVVREGETTYARIADIFRQQSRVAGGLNKATDESSAVPAGVTAMAGAANTDATESWPVNAAHPRSFSPAPPTPAYNSLGPAIQGRNSEDNAPFATPITRSLLSNAGEHQIPPPAADVGEYQLETPPPPVPVLEFDSAEDVLLAAPPNRRSTSKSASRSPRQQAHVSPDFEETTARSVREVEHDASPLSLNPARLTFALQSAIPWAGACAMIVVIGSQLGSPVSPFVMFSTASLTLVYYTIVTATLSNMQSNEAEAIIPPRTSDGWRFAMERLIPLILGPLFVAFSAGSLIAIAGTIIHALSHLKSGGPFFGGLLLFPSFLLAAGTLIAGLSASIIPVIMGVEDCGPSEATGVWLKQNQRNAVQATLNILTIFTRLAPMLLLAMILTLSSLSFSLYLTVDWQYFALMEFNLANLLSLSSIFLIFGIWLAIATSLSTSGLTEYYLRAAKEDETSGA